jgi:hypothetical protein
MICGGLFIHSQLQFIEEQFWSVWKTLLKNRLLMPSLKPKGNAVKNQHRNDNSADTKAFPLHRKVPSAFVVLKVNFYVQPLIFRRKNCIKSFKQTKLCVFPILFHCPNVFFRLNGVLCLSQVQCDALIWFISFNV